MADTQTLPAFPWSAPYTIPREFYRDGFTAFQKKYVLRRSYVMMALFAVLFVSFVISAVNDPTNRLAYFLLVLCLAAIFMLWYNPRKQRRMVLEAVRELEGTEYTACCDGNVLRIRIRQSEEESERIPESRIMLANAMCRHSTGSIWCATAGRCSTSCRKRRRKPLRPSCRRNRKHDCFT